MVSFALRQRRDQYIIRSNTAPVHTHKPMRMRYLTTLLSRLFSFPPLEHVLRLGLWPFVFLITIHDRAPLTGVLLYLSLSLAHTWMRRHRAGYTYDRLTVERFCRASLGISQVCHSNPLSVEHTDTLDFRGDRAEYDARDLVWHFSHNIW